MHLLESIEGTEQFTTVAMNKCLCWPLYRLILLASNAIHAVVVLCGSYSPDARSTF